jgi:predicted ester cyclase
LEQWEVDFIYHAQGEDAKGMENLKEWVSSDRSVFPDIRFTIVDSIAESNKVATAWFVEATHEKEFRGIPATRKIEVRRTILDLMILKS